MEKSNWERICTCLVILLIFVLVANLYFVSTIQKSFAPAKKEQTKIPKIEIYALAQDSCAECFDIKAILPEFEKSTKANVTKSVVLNQNEAKDLIANYEIKRLPAVIVKGDIDALKLPPAFIKTKDALVAGKLPPPYWDLEGNSVKGRVKLTLLQNPSCTDCSNLSLVGEQLQQTGVFFTEQRTVEYDSLEGSSLVKKYGIEFLPTIVLSSEIGEYPVSQALDSIATKESDGSFVMRQIPPPYYDVSLKKVRGLVDSVYLVSSDCKECINSTALKEIMSQTLGIKSKSEKVVDAKSSDGRDLIKKYIIEKIPTVIYSAEAGSYPSMKQWEQIGSIEKDGKYVFRKIELLGNIIRGQKYLLNGTETELAVVK